MIGLDLVGELVTTLSSSAPWPTGEASPVSTNYSRKFYPGINSCEGSISPKSGCAAESTSR